MQNTYEGYLEQVKQQTQKFIRESSIRDYECYISDDLEVKRANIRAVMHDTMDTIAFDVALSHGYKDVFPTVFMQSFKMVRRQKDYYKMNPIFTREQVRKFIEDAMMLKIAAIIKTSK